MSETCGGLSNKPKNEFVSIICCSFTCNFRKQKKEIKRWCQDRCDFTTLKWAPILPPKCLPNKQKDVICNLPSVLLQKLRSTYPSPTVPMLLNFRHTRKTGQLICGQKSTTQRMYFGPFIKQSKRWVCSFECQVQCNWMSPIRICSEFIP
jgi:hypothetical protein